MDYDPLAALGEDWLNANDPDHRPRKDFDLKERAIGLTAELDYSTRRGGKLVEHGALPTAKLCARCLGPFQPRKSDHGFCGDVCRSLARREYKRDQMRRRRAAA